jgi:DNA polymerase
MLMQNVPTLTCDWETFYSKEYSLTKMTTQEYVLSPYFEAIGISVQVNAEEPIWFSGTFEETKEWLQQFPWETSVAIAHNAMFDGSIMEWLFDIHPMRWFCTMMAARPLCAPWTPHGRVSLKVVSEYLGLGVKGTEALNNIGMNRRDFSPERLAQYGEYCRQDTRLCYRIYEKLAPKLPPSEQILISETITKFTRPKILLNPDILRTRLVTLKKEKEELLAKALLVDNKILMSNPQFAEALENLGVVPPTKISPITGKTAYAFAKSDQEFKALLEHDDVRVQTLVAARLKHKSTLEETRLQRFINIADLGAPFGIPLLYYAAHTGRYGGMDKLNLQNLPRGGELREALIAPKGYKIVAGDLSQIEARITAALAGQDDLIRVFADGADPYCYFATNLYGRPITKADTVERFMGKTSILGLGFGMGADKFKASVKSLGGVDITLDEARKIVRKYRAQFSAIPQIWQDMNAAIERMTQPDCYRSVGFLVFIHEGVVLPNGMVINYPNLRIDTHAGGYIYDYRGKPKSIWGGALLENIVQALARIVLSTAEVRLAKRNIHAVMQVHDELVFVIPEAIVEKFCVVLNKVLTAKIDWMPGLPIACEIKYGDNYMECK